MSRIHPTAIVSQEAKISESAGIGPYVIIEGPVSIGPETAVESHAVIRGHTEIGAGNRIGVGAVIGLEPQDRAYKGEKSFVKIGDRNIFREYVQVHRGTKEGTVTVIGNDNFFLGFSHVAHNCNIGNGVVMANGALLAGYVVVGDNAFISGNCLVHQFCRIGRLAMMRGGSRVSLDVPPFCVSDDVNTLRGINSIGLERQGFSSSQILGVRKIYKQVFNTEKPLSMILPDLIASNSDPAIKQFLEFIKNSPRGICRPQKSL